MKNLKKIRVLIVDDHPALRAGLRTIAEADSGLEIVAEAGNAAEALTAMQTFRPDVLLLDVRLPDQSGFEVCRTAKRLTPPPCVLFLTSFADNTLVLNAMEAGADGYLLKEKDVREIADAIHTVLAGGTVFDPVPPRAAGGPAKNASAAKNLLLKLAPQELRVLAEVASGKTDKEIASALDLQAKTVRHYLDRVFEKLGVNTRTQAAMIWMRHRESFTESCFRKIFEKTPPE